VSDATTARYWRERRLLAALVLGPLTAALLAIGILGALGSGCYATTTPVQTCAENPRQEGCLAPIHDSKRPDGGQ
jgi:hypothetical protein